MLTSLFTNVFFISLIALIIIAVALAWLLRRKQQHRNDDYDHDFDPDLYEGVDLYDEDYFDPSEAAAGTPVAARRQPEFDADLVEDAVAEDDFAVAPAEPPQPPRELIVALYVRALGPPGFGGGDIFAAMEQVGCHYGDMAIFHHYGLDEDPLPTAKRRAVFSIANMLEPGTFDPTRRDPFYTTGLVMFMRLPGSLSGRVAFELMLNSAHRLAEILKGELEDERRQPLNTENIAALRNKITAFDYGRSVE